MEKEENKSLPPRYELRDNSKRIYNEDEPTPSPPAFSPEYIDAAYDCFEIEEKVHVKRRKTHNADGSGSSDSSNVSVCSGPETETSKATRDMQFEASNVVQPIQNKLTSQRNRMSLNESPTNSVTTNPRQIDQSDHQNVQDANVSSSSDNSFETEEEREKNDFSLNVVQSIASPSTLQSNQEEDENINEKTEMICKIEAEAKKKGIDVELELALALDSIEHSLTKSNSDFENSLAKLKADHESYEVDARVKVKALKLKAEAELKKINIDSELQIKLLKFNRKKTKRNIK